MRLSLAPKAELGLVAVGPPLPWSASAIFLVSHRPARLAAAATPRELDGAPGDRRFDRERTRLAAAGAFARNPKPQGVGHGDVIATVLPDLATGLRLTERGGLGVRTSQLPPPLTFALYSPS